MPEPEINERDLGTLGSPTSGSTRSHARSCAIMLGLTVLILGALGLGARWWAKYTWSQHREQIREDVRTVQPLLTALEMYRADHDDYPRTLDALTAEYISAIPQPPFQFETPKGWVYRAPAEHVQGGYVLMVSVPSEYSPLEGWFHDALVYHPDETYRREAYGGILERVDGWAYYHE